MEWISVKTPPEQDKWVWGYGKKEADKEYIQASVIRSISFRDGQQMDWYDTHSSGCGCCDCDLEITHWMPLPPPPETVGL